MTERKVNIPLLRKTVEWVEEQEQLEESRWNQRDWFSFHYNLVADQREHFCNTSYCFAGKVVMDAGWTPTTTTFCVKKDGVVRDIADVANELLGLEKLHSLYGATNTASDIREIAEHLAGERL